MLQQSVLSGTTDTAILSTSSCSCLPLRVLQWWRSKEIIQHLINSRLKIRDFPLRLPLKIQMYFSVIIFCSSLSLLITLRKENCASCKTSAPFWSLSWRNSFLWVGISHIHGSALKTQTNELQDVLRWCMPDSCKKSVWWQMQKYWLRYCSFVMVSVCDDLCKGEIFWLIKGMLIWAHWKELHIKLWCSTTTFDNWHKSFTAFTVEIHAWL